VQPKDFEKETTKQKPPGSRIRAGRGKGGDRTERVYLKTHRAVSIKALRIGEQKLLLGGNTPELEKKKPMGRKNSRKKGRCPESLSDEITKRYC